MTNDATWPPAVQRALWPGICRSLDIPESIIPLNSDNLDAFLSVESNRVVNQLPFSGFWQCMTAELTGIIPNLHVEAQQVKVVETWAEAREWLLGSEK